MNFPMIQNPKYPLSGEMENPGIMSKFEDGSQQSRRRITRIRRRWKLQWELLPYSDYQTLKTFWETVGGCTEAFMWSNPEDGNTYEVRFSDEPFPFSNTVLNFYSITLTIIEV